MILWITIAIVVGLIVGISVYDELHLHRHRQTTRPSPNPPTHVRVIKRPKS